MFKNSYCTCTLPFAEPRENVELKGASLMEADPVMLDMLQKILYLHFSSAELRENAQSSEGISPLEADVEMLNKLRMF